MNGFYETYDGNIAYIHCALNFATYSLNFVWLISPFSYNRLGKDGVEADAEEIIDMAGKASLADQQKQVQENAHSQITSFCKYMDHILQPDLTVKDKQGTSSSENNSSPRRSGLSLAIGRTTPSKDRIGKNLKLNFYNTF